MPIDAGWERFFGSTVVARIFLGAVMLILIVFAAGFLVRVLTHGFPTSMEGGSLKASWPDGADGDGEGLSVAVELQRSLQAQERRFGELAEVVAEISREIERLREDVDTLQALPERQAADGET